MWVQVPGGRAPDGPGCIPAYLPDMCVYLFDFGYVQGCCFFCFEFTIVWFGVFGATLFLAVVFCFRC